MNRLVSCAALVASGLVGGCFEATIHSGAPPADPAPGYDQRWHHAFAWGLVEAHSPELSRVCPRGWSQVRTHTDPVHALLFVASLGLYTPEFVTVICARPAISERAPTPPEPALPKTEG